MKSDDCQKANDLAVAGHHDAALALVDEALAASPDNIDALLTQVRLLRICGRDKQAIARIEELERTPLAEDQQARATFAFERGFIHMRSNRFDEAIKYLLEAKELGQTDVDCEGAICLTLCYLGRFDEAAEYRTRVIRLRDAETRGGGVHNPVSTKRPRAFDPSRRERNIVSYSLFGDDPYYHECAVTIARTNPVMFPEFTARFHCAPDLPANVLKALNATGAQVMLSSDPKNPKMSPTAGTFWRFLAFDDPNVDVVMCRDVDSPILPRERAAIDMWLARDEPFYCLRDHAVHAELILAGMWGGFTGVLPKLGPLASAFLPTNSSRYADQRFLCSVIWPLLRDGAILQIDSIASLEGSVDFPPGYPKFGRQHVGMAWLRKQIVQSG